MLAQGLRRGTAGTGVTGDQGSPASGAPRPVRVSPGSRPGARLAAPRGAALRGGAAISSAISPTQTSAMRHPPGARTFATSRDMA